MTSSLRALGPALLCASGQCLAFGIGLPPPPVTVVEYRNTFTNHYFLTGFPEEMAAIDAGASGPGWLRTGRGFIAYAYGNPWCGGCQAVSRFYGTPGLGPNSHFFTASGEEAVGLEQPGSGWSLEGIAFHIPVPDAAGQCAAGVPVYRLYNGRWMFNDSNHRYVTDAGERAAMIAAGWADEGTRFCALGVAEVPFKAFDVQIPLESRILPSAQCEDESQGTGSCLAVNNLVPPSARMGPYDVYSVDPFARLTGVYSPEVYAAGGGYDATPEAVAQGVFVNAVASWVGIHIDTRGRDPTSYASINPLYQMRTAAGPGAADERFFPFAENSPFPGEKQLSIRFGLHVRKIAVHDASSHAYGHPTLEFIDTVSGQHLYFTVLAYGIDTGGDYLAPDVGSGKVIVGTTFRASTPYGRSVGSATLNTPPGFSGFEVGHFDFRMDRGEFQRVIDRARTLNPALSPDPSRYIVDNFHFNNEVVGNAEIGMGIGLFSLQLLPR